MTSLRHSTASLVRAAIIAGIVSLVSATAGAADPIRLGAVEVLSGPNARYGIAIQRGFELAKEEINAGGGVLGGQSLEVSYEDSAGNKDQAINAVRKLIGRDKVALLFGPMLSSEMFAAGPVANGRAIPVIGTSTTAKGITDIGPYIFRTALPESDVVPVTLRIAKEKLGIKRVAVMYGNDEAMTTSAYREMQTSLAQLGIAVIATETFGNKDTDFSAQLTKIKGFDPDAVVIAAYVEAGAGILLQARQLGFDAKIRFIGGNGFNSPKLGDIAGKAADGTIVGAPWFVGKDDPLNTRFVASYRAKYGEEPDLYAAQAYDTMNMVKTAIDGAGEPNGRKIAEALAKVRHQGVLGPFSFTEDRNPAETSGVVVLIMRDGRFEILK